MFDLCLLFIIKCAKEIIITLKSLIINHCSFEKIAHLNCLF